MQIKECDKCGKQCTGPALDRIKTFYYGWGTMPINSLQSVDFCSDCKERVIRDIQEKNAIDGTKKE